MHAFSLVINNYFILRNLCPPEEPKGESTVMWSKMSVVSATLDFSEINFYLWWELEVESCFYFPCYCALIE